MIVFEGCSKGYYATQSGYDRFDKRCRICPTGTYAETDTASNFCIPCPDGKTTANLGSNSSSQCIEGMICYIISVICEKIQVCFSNSFEGLASWTFFTDLVFITSILEF